jgi:hypothetical protein
MHCKKMVVVYVSFRQRAVSEFPVKEGNSAGVIYERLRGVYGDDSSVRRWVKHFKDGNTDIAVQSRCGLCILVVFLEKRETISAALFVRRSTNFFVRFVKNVRRRKLAIFPHDNARLHTARLTLQTIQKNGWDLLSHPPYSTDLAPSDYHLFGPLKDHLRGHHYETDEAVQKVVRRVQKFTDGDGDHVKKKLIKDAYILLTSFVFVCVPSFHCRINVLISFGTTLVYYNTVSKFVKVHSTAKCSDTG